MSQCTSVLESVEDRCVLPAKHTGVHCGGEPFIAYEGFRVWKDPCSCGGCDKFLGWVTCRDDTRLVDTIMKYRGKTLEP